MRHKRRQHTPPVITGTLVYKKAQTAIHKEASNAYQGLSWRGRNATTTGYQNGWVSISEQMGGRKRQCRGNVMLCTANSTKCVIF